MKNLLLQIKNGKIDNLLHKDTYKLYKYLYDYKLDDPHIKTILAGIKGSDLEGIIISLFFNTEVEIDNISYRIYLQEYFPKFGILIKDKGDIKYKLIYAYYQNTISNKNINDNNTKINDTTISNKNINDNNTKINDIINTYIKELIINRDNQLIIHNNTVNNFLIYYNTKKRILLESDESLIINFICKYLSNENIKNIYELLEDKTYLNIEINNRNLFDTLKYKIIRETLVNPLSLVNLKIEKKPFFIALNQATMTYKEILEKNFLKYKEILKIVKYKEKYKLLVEWLKTFIYFGRFDLFKKLFRSMKYKMSHDESEIFNTLYVFLKNKKLINLSPFLMKCGYMKDTEFTVYSYKDLVVRLS